MTEIDFKLSDKFLNAAREKIKLDKKITHKIQFFNYMLDELVNIFDLDLSTCMFLDFSELFETYCALHNVDVKYAFANPGYMSDFTEPYEKYNTPEHTQVSKSFTVAKSLAPKVEKEISSILRKLNKEFSLNLSVKHYVDKDNKKQEYYTQFHIYNDNQVYFKIAGIGSVGKKVFLMNLNCQFLQMRNELPPVIKELRSMSNASAKINNEYYIRGFYLDELLDILQQFISYAITYRKIKAE